MNRIIQVRKECQPSSRLLPVRSSRGRDKSPAEISCLTYTFAIYLSGIFREVEKDVESCMVTSLPDDCRWLVTVNSVGQLCK